MGKNIMVNIWNGTFDLILDIKKIGLSMIDSILTKVVKPPIVRTIDETIDKIIKSKCSVSRYGDGELKLICGRDISFQKHSNLIEERLKEVLTSNNDGHLVCIPDIFGDNKQYTTSNAKAWKTHLIEYRIKWYKNLNMKKEYFNSLISRCYLCFLDRNKSTYIFKNIKKIWDKRDIVIVEGEFSRLGMGNDLFDNVKSVRRVICPKRDAFSKYQEVFSFVKSTIEKDALILIALGPTATILSFDLHMDGYQAIDIGHIDVEYEWYIKNAKKAIPIKNKFINEVNGGNFEEEEVNNKYLNEIIISFNNIQEV